MFSMFPMWEQERKHRIKQKYSVFVLLIYCWTCVLALVSLHLHVICFLLWLISGSRSNIKWRCNKYWKSGSGAGGWKCCHELSGALKLVSKPWNGKAGRAGLFCPLLLPLCLLPPICSAIKCCNVSSSL